MLQQLVKEIIGKYSDLRAAGHALEIDHVYLYRLANGERTDPSDEVLQKLGLRRIVTYEPLPRKRKPAARRK